MTARNLPAVTDELLAYDPRAPEPQRTLLRATEHSGGGVDEAGKFAAPTTFGEGGGLSEPVALACSAGRHDG